MIFFKAIIGIIIILVIYSLSKNNKYYYISGLLPLFPTFGIIGEILVYNELGKSALENTIIFSMFSILSYFGYLITFLFLMKKNIKNKTFKVYNIILISLIVWLFISFILVLLWKEV